MIFYNQTKYIHISEEDKEKGRSLRVALTTYRSFTYKKINEVSPLKIVKYTKKNNISQSPIHSFGLHQLVFHSSKKSKVDKDLITYDDPRFSSPTF